MAKHSYMQGKGLAQMLGSGCPLRFAGAKGSKN